MKPVFPLEGGCTCGHIRYRMLTEPLIVHCCHCRWCQRETGTAFALNAMIESDRVLALSDPPPLIATPSNSGKGQQVARCPNCHVAVWSHYAGTGTLTKFVRVGTLDDPTALAPDVHIFVSSRQPWVRLPDDVMACDGFYDRAEVWRPDSLARLKALLPVEDPRA